MTPFTSKIPLIKLSVWLLRSKGVQNFLHSSFKNGRFYRYKTARTASAAKAASPAARALRIMEYSQKARIRITKNKIKKEADAVSEIKLDRFRTILDTNSRAKQITAAMI